MENYRVRETENVNPEKVGKILTEEQVIKEFSTKYYTIDQSGIKQLIQLGILESTASPKVIELSITDCDKFHGLTRKDGKRFTPEMKSACEKVISELISKSNGKV